jgi:hypothetical protein
MSFAELPRDLIRGRTFNEFIVDQNSVKLNFSDNLGIMIQTNIRQHISNDLCFDYDIWDNDSTLLLNKFLRMNVIDLKIIDENNLSIIFDDNMYISIITPQIEKNDTVTIYIDGVLEYIF